MGDTLLQERYARVLDRLDTACAAAGRSRQSVRLIAVSKLHPAESLARVAATGRELLAERGAWGALAAEGGP